MHKTKKDKTDRELMKEEKQQLGEYEENIHHDSTGEDVINQKSEKEKISELESKILDVKDMLLRKAAEFENYKRRSESEMNSFYQYSNEVMIKSLLPILDDFERLLNTNPNKKEEQALIKGVDLLYHKFKKVLEKQGLKEIDCKGKDFDVNLEDALMLQPDETHPPNTVLEVVEKGYYLKEKVLRHAKVIVSKEPE